MIKKLVVQWWAVAVLAVGGLTACGGGGGGGSAPPPPATYPVGGNVSGLQGTVTLKNGADTLPVASNGAFTFQTPLATGASYAATVDTQPTGQTCAVAGGTGAVSTAAVTSIQVTCTTNLAPMAGRTWRSGVLVEQGTTDVVTFAAAPGGDIGISDDGRAVALFIQPGTSGTGSLRASIGTAGANATPPVWAAADLIDAAAPIYYLDNGYNRPHLAVSPNGNALVVWKTSQACGSDSYNPIGPSCRYLYASRRLATATAWETPVKVASTPQLYGEALPAINDNGDAAILFDGATSNSISSHRATVALRGATEAGFRVEMLNQVTVSNVVLVGQYVQFGLDKAARVTVVAQQATDLVAYRGTVAAGFGATPAADAVETGTDTATLYRARVGADGAVAVLWKQTTPTTLNATLASVYLPSTGSWSPQQDLSAALGTSLSAALALRVPDGTAGDVVLFKDCTVTRRTTTVWQPTVDLGGGCAIGVTEGMGPWAVDRNGKNFIAVDPDTSLWRAYDVATSAFVKSVPTGTPVAGDYVLGVSAYPAGLFTVSSTQYTTALSPLGYGVMAVRNQYTQLPATGGLNGASGTAVNLWGIYFK